MGHGILAPTIPSFASTELHLSGAQIGSILSAFAAARLCVNTPAGYFADKFGRKKLLWFGPMVTTMANMNTFTSGSYYELLGARFLAGVGSSMYTTGASVSLSDIAKTENKGMMNGGNAMNMHQGAALAGAAIGPGLISAMYALGGEDIRTPFLFATALSGSLSAVALYAAPETKHLSSSSSSSSSLSSSSTHEGGDETTTPTTPTSEKKTQLLQPGGSMTMDASLTLNKDAIEKQKSQPASADSRQLGMLVKRSDFWSVCFLNSALFFAGAGGRGAVLPILAISHGMDAQNLGMLFSAMATTSLIGLVPSSKLITTFGARNVIAPTTVLSSLAVMAIAGSSTDAGFAAACVSWAAASSIMGAAPMTFVAEIAPRKASGAALSIYRNSGDVGLLLGPVLSGLAVDFFGSEVALAMNASVLVSAALAFHVSKTSREKMKKKEMLQQERHRSSK
jgi:MFS family permease